MNKAWRIVGGIALVCLVLGVLGVGAGFFAGSSPVVIKSHGNLVEYAQRLQINWDILRQSIGRLF